MPGIIPHMFDSCADPVVHLLLLKISMAQWIRQRLPNFGPGLEYQPLHLRFHYFLSNITLRCICHSIVKKTKIKAENSLKISESLLASCPTHISRVHGHLGRTKIISKWKKILLLIPRQRTVEYLPTQIKIYFILNHQRRKDLSQIDTGVSHVNRYY